MLCYTLLIAVTRSKNNRDIMFIVTMGLAVLVASVLCTLRGGG